jgi:hypothetical protein
VGPQAKARLAWSQFLGGYGAEAGGDGSDGKLQAVSAGCTEEVDGGEQEQGLCLPGTSSDAHEGSRSASYAYESAHLPSMLPQSPFPSSLPRPPRWR